MSRSDLAPRQRWLGPAGAIALGLGISVALAAWVARMLLFPPSLGEALALFPSRPLEIYYIGCVSLIPVLAVGLLIGWRMPRYGALAALTAGLGPAVIASTGLASGADSWLTYPIALAYMAVGLVGWWAGRAVRSRVLAAVICFILLGAMPIIGNAVTRRPKRWVADQTLRVARDLGAQVNHTPQITITPPAFLHGRIYDFEAEVEDQDPVRMVSEHVWLMLDKSDLYHSALGNAYAAREVSCYKAVAAANERDARSCAAAANVPNRFLVGLREAGPKPPGDYRLAASDHPLFIAGPRPDKGTWTHPHVEISGTEILIEVGERSD